MGCQYDMGVRDLGQEWCMGCYDMEIWEELDLEWYMGCQYDMGF